MFINKIIDFLLIYRIRRCLYCRKIKFCAYVDYRIIKNGKHDGGIKGNFCSNCGKRTNEDIFKKLKDEQYYIFRSIDASWDDTKGGNQ